MAKIIDNSHYHVWTDALHLRQLARETTDQWDRATYVRAAVIMGWVAFETMLAEVLSAHRLGGRFRENLNAAVQAANLPPLDWGQGVWQAVGLLNARRVDYVHRTVSIGDLFPGLSTADEAFATIRSALSDIHQKAGIELPSWVADDSDRGWTGCGATNNFAYATVTHGGVDQDAPDTIKIMFVDARGEHTHSYHPSNADPQQLAIDLLNNLCQPVSVIRVYRGSNLDFEWFLRMRGVP